MNSPEKIINDLNSIDLYDILFLCNNMTKPLLFKDQIISQYNYILITIMALRILCYA